MIVYQSDLVEVHHADALDVLPTLETESVDLVVTDPPYGLDELPPAEEFSLVMRRPG